jgi:hypothetical protein
VGFQVCTAERMKITAFWDVAPCSLVDVDRRFRALTMEAKRICETPVYFYETTLRHIPEGCHLQLNMNCKIWYYEV